MWRREHDHLYLWKVLKRWIKSAFLISKIKYHISEKTNLAHSLHFSGCTNAFTAINCLVCEILNASYQNTEKGNIPKLGQGISYNTFLFIMLFLCIWKETCEFWKPFSYCIKIDILWLRSKRIDILGHWQVDLKPSCLLKSQKNEEQKASNNKSWLFTVETWNGAKCSRTKSKYYLNLTTQNFWGHIWDKPENN